MAGLVRDFDPTTYIDRKEARRMDQVYSICCCGFPCCYGNASLDSKNIDAKRFGVVLGTGIGGLETLENQTNILLPKDQTG